jgi:hypothetical protein
MRQEKELIRAQRKIIEEERLKVIQLKEELRIIEENVLQGMIPNVSKIMAGDRNESPDPSAPKHKKIKMDDDKSEDNLGLEGSSSEDKINIKKEPPQDDGKALKLVPIYFDENDRVHYEETTAYTASTRDKSNILIVKKDPKAIRSAADTIREATKPKTLCAHQPRLPTQEEISTVLNAWRALLRSTGDYYPDKKKTPEEHLYDLKALMSARGSFNRNRDTPIARHQWKHQEFGPIQRQYFIPSEYMAPDAFFEKFRKDDDNQIVYYKRICSVRDYYEMLSHDNPEYKPRVPRITKPNPNPRDYRPAPRKNIAYNPYASGDKAPSGKWGQGLMSTTTNTSQHDAWRNQNNGLMGETSGAPVISAPTITNASKITNAPLSDKIRHEEQKITSFSVEQQEAAERTHRYRSDTSRSTVPIPTSENEDSQEEDSDSLFDDKLIPAEKSKILRLRKEIKRIKGGQTYPTGYENDRARHIKSADALRLEGKPFPNYLEGVAPPWIGIGKANRAYDDNEISKREAKIEKIKRLNAEHCQLEHIANMPSIERKGGPGGQVQN